MEAFLKDPTLKMTEFAMKNKMSVATVSRAVKSEGGKSLKRLKIPLLTPAIAAIEGPAPNSSTLSFDSYTNLVGRSFSLRSSCSY